VWDLDTGFRLLTRRSQSPEIAGAVLTPDGKQAISWSKDNTREVWDLQTGHVSRTPEIRSFGTKVATGGKWAISRSARSFDTWEVRDIHTGRVVYTLEGHVGLIHDVAVTTEGKAVSASQDKTLKVWDLARLQEGEALDGTVPPPDADGASITPQGHSASILGVAIVTNGKLAMSASLDFTLKLWDLDNGRVLRTLEGHRCPVTDVAIMPEQNRAVATFSDGKLKIWDLDYGRVLHEMSCHSAAVDGVAVTPDGKGLVSASLDKTLAVWNLAAWRFRIFRVPVRALVGHSGGVTDVAVTPDGRRVVSASFDGTVRVWMIRNGRPLHTLRGHASEVRGVAVLPDGKRAVSASGDRTLKIWDIDGCELRTLKGHAALVEGVAVTVDGTRVVSASWDNTIKVWDINTGKCITTFRLESAARCCACAAPNRIVAGAAGGRIYFLALEE
jgi:WD40 repeat protein